MDDRLRELARDAAAGDVEAGGRWLAERLRLKELTRKQLERAAWLGHEPARLALGAPPGATDLHLWVAGLVAEWPEVAHRVAAEVVHAAVSLRPPSRSKLRAVDLVAMVVAWADCACDDHAAPLAIGLRVDDPVDDPVAADLGRRLLESAGRSARLIDDRLVDGPESGAHGGGRAPGSRGGGPGARPAAGPAPPPGAGRGAVTWTMGSSDAWAVF